MMPNGELLNRIAHKLDTYNEDTNVIAELRGSNEHLQLSKES